MIYSSMFLNGHIQNELAIHYHTFHDCKQAIVLYPAASICISINCSSPGAVLYQVWPANVRMLVTYMMGIPDLRLFWGETSQWRYVIWIPLTKKNMIVHYNFPRKIIYEVDLHRSWTQLFDKRTAHVPMGYKTRPDLERKLWNQQLSSTAAMPIGLWHAKQLAALTPGHDISLGNTGTAPRRILDYPSLIIRLAIGKHLRHVSTVISPG